jgi:hypothetical protein
LGSREGISGGVGRGDEEMEGVSWNYYKTQWYLDGGLYKSPSLQGDKEGRDTPDCVAKVCHKEEKMCERFKAQFPRGR